MVLFISLWNILDCKDPVSPFYHFFTAFYFLSHCLVVYQLEPSPLLCLPGPSPPPTTYTLDICLFFLSSFFFLVFLGPYPWHVEVPRLGVQLELVNATATAMLDPSWVCDLHHSSWQPAKRGQGSHSGIESESSWMLVGFVTAEPRQEPHFLGRITLM